MNNIKLIPNVDYYLNANGDLVFTEAYHLKRGHCCQSGCLHCPYGKKFDPFIPAELQDVSHECSLDEEFDSED